MEHLDFECRFYDDGKCQKNQNKCNHKNHIDCKYYEYPLNVIFIDNLKFKTGFTCNKNHSTVLAEIKEGFATCGQCKKLVKGKVLPNEPKEAVYKFVNQYNNFDSFYFISSERYNKFKNLLFINKFLEKTRLFKVSGINSYTFTHIANMCNECGYCPICRKYVKFKEVNKVFVCSKCGNHNLKRKVFDRKHDKCPTCKSTNYISNKKWQVKSFEVSKTVFN